MPRLAMNIGEVHAGSFLNGASTGIILESTEKLIELNEADISGVRWNRCLLVLIIEIVPDKPEK